MKPAFSSERNFEHYDYHSSYVTILELKYLLFSLKLIPLNCIARQSFLRIISRVN